ncbi:MAG: DUF1289 domain-containing protein [Oceanospirillaceae bacterium]
MINKPTKVKEIATPVRNPCMGVCCLDNQDLCIACKRSGIEIAEWGLYGEAQKKAVLVKVEERYSQAL